MIKNSKILKKKRKKNININLHSKVIPIDLYQFDKFYSR